MLIVLLIIAVLVFGGLYTGRRSRRRRGTRTRR
jgi:hypothetical protein